jgi:hypothetical protein
MTLANDLPTHINIRLDSKIRYITEIAARARFMSLTEYAEAALASSFKSVSVDLFELLDLEAESHNLSQDDRLEKLKNRSRHVSNPLSEVMDSLWSEHAIVRLQLLAGHLEHLMSEEDRSIWSYLFTRGDLAQRSGDSTYTLNRELITEQWSTIKLAALSVAREVK